MKFRMVEPSTAVEKAVDVLFHLHREASPQGVSAVGHALGLPKSSAHRLLASLRRRGLVERDERGRYRPGIGLVALGLGALEREPVVVVARPVLEAEAQALGETVFLVGARAGDLVVLDKAEGTGFLRAAPRVGSAVPVHASAVGRLFLAFAPEAIRTPRATLERFTSKTPHTASQLDRAVARARERGCAESRDEWIPGLSAVAAPIRAADRVRAALAVAIPTARIGDWDREVLARRIVASAARIAGRMEGTAT
jgi:IclR family acetate operon transcriptional repressor